MNRRKPPEAEPAANRNGGGVRDHLANERTLLSWVRLSLAISALGFVVARFGLFVERLLAANRVPSAGTGLSLPIGVLLVLAGPVLAVLALLRYRTVEEEIRTGEYRSHHALIYTLITMAVVVGVGLAIYLVIASGHGAA